MAVSYEWCFEEISDEGDIVGLYFEESYVKCIKRWRKLKASGRVVLVRDQYDEYNGLAMREWAAVSDAVFLPNLFSEGTKVPRRFHREVQAQR